MVNLNSTNSFNVKPFEEKAPEGIFETIGSFAGMIYKTPLALVREEQCKTAYAVNYFGTLGSIDAQGHKSLQAPSADIHYTLDGVNSTVIKMPQILTLVQNGTIGVNTYMWTPGMMTWERAGVLYPEYFQAPVMPVIPAPAAAPVIPQVVQEDSNTLKISREELNNLLAVSATNSSSELDKIMAERKKLETYLEANKAILEKAEALQAKIAHKEDSNTLKIVQEELNSLLADAVATAIATAIAATPKEILEVKEESKRNVDNTAPGKGRIADKLNIA